MTKKQLRWRATAALYGFPPTRWIPSAGRRAVGDVLDMRDALLRRGRAWYVPPRRLRFVGGGNYLYVAETFRELFRAYGGLDEDTDVLDIGSGNGRMALAVLGVMGKGAPYEGFDVVPEGVEWCQEWIAPHFPSARFQVADIQNERYNPHGQQTAANYRFPYDDDSFDLAIATSLFTHLDQDDAANYVAQARRCLRPGGRLLGTWYLIDPGHPRGHGAVGEERIWFPLEMPGGMRVVSSRVPEFSVAQPLEWVLEVHKRAGFDSVNVHFGQWLGADGPTGQDLIVATA